MNICQAAGCPDPGVRRFEGKQYCRKHQLRLRRHGDASYEYRGQNVYNWAGEDIGYGTLHNRLRQVRGPVTDRFCPCGRQAQHWAYDGTDPEPLTSPSGIQYSADLSRYVPRCVPCHKRFDLDRLARPVEQPLQRGELSSSAKLTVEQVVAIRERVRRGETHRSLAREYRVSHTTIGAIARRTKWRYLVKRS